MADTALILPATNKLRLPKGTNAEQLTREDCIKIIEKSNKKTKRALTEAMTDLNNYFNPVSIESSGIEYLTAQAGFPIILSSTLKFPGPRFAQI